MTQAPQPANNTHSSDIHLALLGSRHTQSVFRVLIGPDVVSRPTVAVPEQAAVEERLQPGVAPPVGATYSTTYC